MGGDMEGWEERILHFLTLNDAARFSGVLNRKDICLKYTRTRACILFLLVCLLYARDRTSRYVSQLQLNGFILDLNY